MPESAGDTPPYALRTDPPNLFERIRFSAALKQTLTVVGVSTASELRVTASGLRGAERPLSTQSRHSASSASALVDASVSSVSAVVSHIDVLV